jgi:NAD(P)-dependent dehydrogenase (short-subunit alcohol dehydrogenase family)
MTFRRVSPAAPAGVIVTGATGALGAAVVRELLGLGSRVAVPFRDDRGWRTLQQAVADPAAPGESLFGLEAAIDTAEGASRFVDAATSLLGGIDGVALVAGAWRGGAPFDAAPAEDWTAMLRQNLDTAAWVSRAALPALARTRGSLVAVGSQAAETGGAGMAAYAVSKSALHALVRVLALENRERGVRVNAVLPGTIDTAANRSAMPAADRSSWTPPEAIARTIAFLLSPDSAPVSGALVPVDGATPRG